MADGRARTATFPVFFFNGEREANVGDVEIYPALEYKSFQLMLSQKIGVSPNQISTYLVDWKNTARSPFAGDRHRTPITGKTDFASLCRRKDCCFLSILKRSRKARGRRGRSIDRFAAVEFSPAPEDLVILRKGRAIGSLEVGDFAGYFVDPPVVNSGLDDPDPDSHIGGCGAFCKECWMATRMGYTAPFHPCVKDPVITRFETRLGPINRPSNPQAVAIGV
ncbi:Unknown protein [Striga hermonthica]|uniref:DUF7138 domain-containing protein n=1 Tax=Striga hermonthica TaxID=68872 RepID=A0A9N7P0V8_STRHE|nr:Unknown protein [Striga hermonthica]